MDWVVERQPDLVCVTGDLVSHPRGEPLFRALLRRLGTPYVVLGNHDVAVTRDPFSRAAELDDLREESVLLRDEAVEVELRGRRVQLVGLDPLSYRHRGLRAAELADPHADLRILFCHFPGIARRLLPASFDLILAGHLHDGQISIPIPGGKVPLTHPGAPEVAGIYRYPSGVLHVSPGLGTTFVPFRFCSRPEVTELCSRASSTSGRTREALVRKSTDFRRLTRFHVTVGLAQRYAADAAQEVAGVHGLVDGPLPRHRGARVTEQDGSLAVELHLAVEWGTDVSELGVAVQRRVADYLGRMSGLAVTDVVVVVDEVATPPAVS